MPLCPQQCQPLTPLPGIFATCTICALHTFYYMEQALGAAVWAMLGGSTAQAPGRLVAGGGSPPSSPTSGRCGPRRRLAEFHPLGTRVFSVLWLLKEAGCCQLP